MIRNLKTVSARQYALTYSKGYFEMRHLAGILVCISIFSVGFYLGWLYRGAESISQPQSAVLPSRWNEAGSKVGESTVTTQKSEISTQLYLDPDEGGNRVQYSTQYPEQAEPLVAAAPVPVPEKRYERIDKDVYLEPPEMPARASP